MLNLQHYYKATRICHLCRATKWNYMKAPSTLNNEFRHSLDTFLQEAVRPGPSPLQVQFDSFCFSNLIESWLNIQWYRSTSDQLSWAEVHWHNCHSLLPIYWSSARCTLWILGWICGWQDPHSSYCWNIPPMRFGRVCLLRKGYPMHIMNFAHGHVKRSFSI